MKKIIALFLVCGLSVFAIAGCGGRPAPPEATPADDATEMDPAAMDAESGGDSEAPAE